MACKQVDPHDICEECPEWIFTLADLIMCMMGLFVILWVLKPEGKPPAAGAGTAQAASGQQAQTAPSLEEAIAAIRGAFGYEPDPNSADPIDRALIMQRLRAHRPGDGERGNTFKPADGAQGTDSDVTTIRLGPQAAIGGPVQFEAGSADLSPTMRRQLDQIASLVRGHRNVILVKGHTSTDDLPDDSTAQQRLDLSLRRAQTVADYLVSLGVAPDTVRVLGCSTFEPVRARAYATDQRAMNRRVEVEVTATIAEQFQDRPRTAPLHGN
jgi:outer membrane protein OmpA-like peptidoglycan-associated protein